MIAEERPLKESYWFDKVHHKKETSQLTFSSRFCTLKVQFINIFLKTPHEDN